MNYLKNAWYAAAWSTEVTRELMTKTFLDEPVLLYRKLNGEAVAIGNRCPHRFAPLHMGRLFGDVVECGYHGLSFDRTGSCVSNPHGDGRIPAAALVKAYPLEEKHGLLWIWMGSPHLADPAAIPNFDYLDAEGRRTISGHMMTASNYQLIIDNLMDLSHTPYLHAPQQSVDGLVQASHKVSQEGNSVNSERMVKTTTAPASLGRFMDDPKTPVDYWLNIRWHPPGACQLEAGIKPVEGAAGPSFRRLGTHLVTPETATTSHYFYALTRDFALDDAGADAQTKEWQRIGFHEQDKPMLVAVQKMMGTYALESLSPVLLTSDAAAMRVRRVFKQMLADEAKLTAANQAPLQEIVRNA